jgi:tRNA threonylcarbamoyladenosine biosynthesis protein TsaE
MAHRTFQSPEQTRAFGQRLGETAVSGCVAALVGELGAGKTCLSQGIAAGLSVRGPITSPTFVIVQAYPDGRLPFFHADYYRLGEDSELVELGLDEILEGEGVVAVEWADRFWETLPADHLRLTLEFGGPLTRSLAVEATGPRSAAWWEAARVD